MRIGIIETGKPSATLEELFGDYPFMFEQLIGATLGDASFFTKCIVSGEKTGAPEQADGWLITGSRHGAYDRQPWIEPLEEFIRECFAKSKPMIGVCFGHQIIAQAMGGKVQKSNKGWAVGPEKYNISNKPDWMTHLSKTYTSHAIHQDQIIEIPKNATVISSSGFCEFAGLLYGNPDAPNAITVQSHPELSDGFVKKIGAERLAKVVPEHTLKAGLARLGTEVNNAEWGKTFSQYFQRAITANS